MSERDVELVGASRDEEALLAIAAGAWDLESALDAELLVRCKITCQWLYATSPAALDAALDRVESAAIERLEAWLIGATPYLRHPIANTATRPRITYRAVELLIRELIRQNRLGTLGLLTGSYEPYLGLYAPSDEDEIAIQLEAMRASLRARGQLWSSDLPEPKRPREAKAWRSVVLRHGEFLGLGRLVDGRLIAFETDAP